MDKIRLFKAFAKEEKSVLLDLLSSAHEQMTTAQRKYAWGDYAESLPPEEVDAEDLPRMSGKATSRIYNDRREWIWRWMRANASLASCAAFDATHVFILDKFLVLE